MLVEVLKFPEVALGYATFPNFTQHKNPQITFITSSTSINLRSSSPAPPFSGAAGLKKCQMPKPKSQIKAPSIDPKTTIGHVHLKVSDLKRAVKFYTEVLGFDVTTTMGDRAAFLSAGGYHHHIGLNTWESQGGSAPAPGTTGLYHFAILLPDRKALARAVKRLADLKWPIDGAADHGVSESIYLRDPDNNGIELYSDRPRSQWPKDAQGKMVMYTHPLDFDSVMAELEK